MSTRLSEELYQRRDESRIVNADDMCWVLQCQHHDDEGSGVGVS
jgi:hypothetical protein